MFLGSLSTFEKGKIERLTDRGQLGLETSLKTKGVSDCDFVSVAKYFLEFPPFDALSSAVKRERA